jgi:hypothetical protein
MACSRPRKDVSWVALAPWTDSLPSPTFVGESVDRTLEALWTLISEASGLRVYLEFLLGQDSGGIKIVGEPVKAGPC